MKQNNRTHIIQKNNKYAENLLSTKKVARMGIFVALAMIFSYVEALIVVPIPVPGIKLGVANLVVMTGLYLFSTMEVILISIVRVILMGLLFGNGLSIIYSLTGAVLSLLAMLIAKRLKIFSVTGNSILGATFHNIGQISIAALLLESTEMFYYLPILCIAAIITGFLIGFLAERVINITKKLEIFI